MGIGRGLWNASLLYWLQMNRAARYYTTHTEASAFTEAYCGPFCVWCPLGIRHRGHQAGLRRPCFFRQPTTDPVQVMFLSSQYVSQHHTDSSLNNNPKHLPLSIAMYRETRGVCKHSPLHRRRTCRVSRLVSYSLQQFCSARRRQAAPCACSWRHDASRLGRYIHSMRVLPSGNMPK
jgi:hypothetical protein